MSIPQPPTLEAPRTRAASDARAHLAAPDRTKTDPPRLVSIVGLLAIAVYAVVGIGAPLLGHGVFAGTDELSGFSPYRDAGLHGTQVQNHLINDTYTAALPNTQLFVDALRQGELAAWNPYISGGVPLGATPNYALLSPLSLPFYLLPTWAAPAYVKLLEIVCAVAGCFLFLRRLRLGRPAALLGGLVFASSAFLVAWTNWPQTRVAALIPWVFWATERLVQRRRPRDVAVLALPLAAMILGGFPSVTAYTIYSAGAYLLVRAAVRPRDWRRVVGLVGGAGAALAGAIGLAAIQLVPFVAFYTSWLIEGRAQTPDRHLRLENLVTSVAPFAAGGTDLYDPPTFYLAGNYIENLSYLGAVPLVLVLVAVAAGRAGRLALPRAVWLFLVIGTRGWALLIYGGGWPLQLAQQLPVFSSNFVGRSRCILGFLLAALAAVGFELLLRQRPDLPRPPRRHRGLRALLWPALVWGGALGLGIAAVIQARGSAIAADARTPLVVSRVAHLDTQLLVAGVLLVAAVLCVAVARRGPWWGPRSYRRRRVAWVAVAALLPVLVAAQALTLVIPFYPRVDRALFYPQTDVHRYLADHLGHERYVGVRTAMVMGADSAARLRALNGHAFLHARFATMLRGAPDNPVPYPTHIKFWARPAQAQSPVLDRLGVRYFVTSPRDPVFGRTQTVPGDGSSVLLEPEQPVTVPVPGSGPVRAVGVTPTQPHPDAASIEGRIAVSLRDPDGRTVASASRLATAFRPGAPWLIPVRTEGHDGVAADVPLTAVLTLRGSDPLPVRATRDGVPALTRVVPTEDGLRIAHAGSAVVYERLTTLPRIRWASGVVVEPASSRRVALLAGYTVDDRRVDENDVVLDAPAGPADGRPAEVEIEEDGLDAIRVTVDAAGAGHLVVPDALQKGWAATVDGRPARLVPADEGVVAVPVPAGRHTVTLAYASPWRGLGTWLTAVTAALLLLVATVGDRWWQRRRSKRLLNPADCLDGARRLPPKTGASG